MSVLEFVGAAFLLAVLGIIAVIAWTIAGNIYGGIKGAYRLRAILARSGRPKFPHKTALRMGLDGWSGKRYKNGLGHSWRLGGVIVPCDGRDRLEHETWL